MRLSRIWLRLLLIVAVLVHGAALARHDLLMARPAAAKGNGPAADAPATEARIAVPDPGASALEAALHDTCLVVGGTPSGASPADGKPAGGDGGGMSLAKCTACATVSADAPPAGGPVLDGPAATSGAAVLAAASPDRAGRGTMRPPATGPPASV